MKNQKGITLIALVITIIVLLILAGITIAMLTGENGLLTKSTAAAADSKVAAAKEEATLEIQKQYADCVEAFYKNTSNVGGSTHPSLTTTAASGTNWSINTSNAITISVKDGKGRDVSGAVSSTGVITWTPND